MSSEASGWTILVPLKATARGKSRLDLPTAMRQRLALAMALDTVSAAAACARVVVVVEDEVDAAALAEVSGVRVHRTGVTGLNESIRDGLKALSMTGGHRPAGRAGRVAVLPGDLPSLHPGELAEVLARCTLQRFSVVADHQGVGSTLLAAIDISALEPQYGPNSFQRHLAAGATPVELPAGSSLHWDVDTVGDLATVTGSFTRAALAAAAPNGRWD